MNLPSVKTLSQLTDDLTKAKALRQLLDTFAKRDSLQLQALLEEHYPRTREWQRSCYNAPKNIDLTLEAANELLGAYGVEAIEHNGLYVGSYLNTGDTYNATLLYIAGRFSVGSWGDVVERL